MNSLFKDDRGATVVEFSLVALPVFLFIFGIMQTAWIIWADNLLQMSVDVGARCGAVSSTTPCDMTQVANTVFGPLGGATFTANGSSCAADGGTGLVGTYKISILSVINMTLTAKSCYPIISS